MKCLPGSEPGGQYFPNPNQVFCLASRRYYECLYWHYLMASATGFLFNIISKPDLFPGLPLGIHKGRMGTALFARTGSSGAFRPATLFSSFSDGPPTGEMDKCCFDLSGPL